MNNLDMHETLKVKNSSNIKNVLHFKHIYKYYQPLQWAICYT
jgi:hypothetical protein